VADSFLDHSVEGEHVYANPDFELILKYIVHFLEGQRKAPERTSGTFVLPVWMWATFWRLLRGAKVLHPAGGAFVHEPGVEDQGCGGEAAGSGSHGGDAVGSGVDPFSTIG
jgi:hypothetical protein